MCIKASTQHAIDKVVAVNEHAIPKPHISLVAAHQRTGVKKFHLANPTRRSRNYFALLRKQNRERRDRLHPSRAHTVLRSFRKRDYGDANDDHPQKNDRPKCLGHANGGIPNRDENELDLPLLKHAQHDTEAGSRKSPPRRTATAIRLKVFDT